ncbi:hypothetical protein MKW92_052795, partial [Papaver armeniacum]
DANQSNKDQGVSDSVEELKEPVFRSNEVSFVKEQSPEHQHLVFSPSMNTTFGSFSKQQHKCVLERPSTEDDSSASGGLRYTYQKWKRVVPLTEDVSLASVLHADACVTGEEASEDNDGMTYEDLGPVMVSPPITASKTSSHEDEMTILYADVSCENISAKEEVFMPSSESGSQIFYKIRDMAKANDSLDTTVKHQDNYSGDQTSCSLTFKDDIQGDAGSGGHSYRLRKQSTEKRITSKKVDQFWRLVREDASESDSDGARYTRRRARRVDLPHSRWRRKCRSPRRRKDRRNRSRRQDNRGQIPHCMDFLRGRCFRGESCKYLHHTSTSGDPVKDNKSRNQEYLELPQDPRNSDINGVSQIVMNTNVGNTNPLSQVSVEHGTSFKEEFKNQEIVNKNSGSVMDDGRRVTSSGSVQSAAGVNLSDSEAAITGVIVPQAPLEELGVQLKENEIFSQNEPSSLPNNMVPPQTNIPSSQSSLVDVSILSTQPISQPFCGHPSNPYAIPTSMSQTQVHQVTATSSFPLQNVAPQPTDSKEFQQHNFTSSGFYSYAFPLSRPPAFPQDINAAYMSMPPTTNIYGQLTPMERHPLYQAPFHDQHSQFPVPPQQTWAPLPPASNSAFQNPAFHLQPYSHEVPYKNLSQLSVAGAFKLHHNPYASILNKLLETPDLVQFLCKIWSPTTEITMIHFTDLPLGSSRSGGQVPGNENLSLFESVGSSSTTLGKLGNTGRQAFGDTAIDAEVGAVENGSPHLAEEGNWSPENPADGGNAASGDDDIGQFETSGKSKKSKDSRSMTHFRAALADFVKEVLKPSWRQGNMSKEAFKTISLAKINQYMESSQRKLTKLVMGYVDKYVKYEGFEVHLTIFYAPPSKC